jgi:peptidylprolyl isomerase
MPQAKRGDTVRVHFTGRLDDGREFGSTAGGEPVEVVLGEEGVIPGFKEAIVGMSPGDKKRARISPEKGFGPHRNELVSEVDRDRLPDGVGPGERLHTRASDGSQRDVTVTEVSGSKATVDANHPLAGKELLFEIELVEIM